MQLTINQIWDLEQARCRFGKYLRVAVNGKAPDVARLISEFPVRREMTEQGELQRGLPVRLQVLRHGAGAEAVENAGVGATAELQLGDESRFYPSDAALAAWRAQADEGMAVIAYE
jgi:DNA polymerase-3 subunit alpha